MGDPHKRNPVQMEPGSESDSDFYGDTEGVARLRRRVRLAVVAASRNDSESVPAAHRAVGEPPRAQVSNPFAGVPYAWQLGESVGDFVSRLPPASTIADVHTPWIYVCNPHASRRKKAVAGNQMIAGCEDEGPEAEDTQTVLFEQGGKERLELLRGFIDATANMGLPRGAAVAEADSARRSAVSDVLGLASRLGVTCGKWMLFVSPGTVNKVWEVVVRSTVRNELGIAAKVAPQNPAVDSETEARRPRLICIYTGDFRDCLDVRRVLRRLEALDLLPMSGEEIYYKCDAYTYLGIGATNPWGLRASLYSSHDFPAR